MKPIWQFELACKTASLTILLSHSGQFDSEDFIYSILSHINMCKHYINDDVY